MSGLGNLSDFIENKGSIVDLSWLKVEPGVDYDNIPSENLAEAIPQLVGAWDHFSDHNTKFIPNQVSGVGTNKVVVGPQEIVDVVKTAKKAMMSGLSGQELSSHLRERFTESLIRTASDELRKVAAEQGLLGNVYVDLSAFDTTKEASQYLGKHRIRLAKFAIGQPAREVNYKDAYGNARNIGKRVVASVEYTPELLAEYTSHLRVAGRLEADETLDSKESLREAFMRTPRKASAPMRASVEAEDKKDDGKDAVDTLARDASDRHFSAGIKVFAFMQDQMLKGLLGAELKSVIASKIAPELLTKYASELKKLASLQGLLGTVYADVSLYSNADDAINAVKKASNSPRYLVETRPAGDNRLARVASATGCAVLPKNGKVDVKMASSYVNDLMFKDRIASGTASSMKDRLAGDENPLTIIREAYLATIDHKPAIREGGVEARYAQAEAAHYNVSDKLHTAAQEALSKGFPVDIVESKTASLTTTLQAHGLVRKAMASLDEVHASSLTKCASEKYPMKKNAHLIPADKCASCVLRTGSSCTKQAAFFVGKKADEEAGLGQPQVKKASSTQGYGLKLDGMDISYQDVIDPPKYSIADDLRNGQSGMDAFFG